MSGYGAPLCVGDDLAERQNQILQVDEALMEQEGDVRLWRVGRSLAGLRGDHPQVAWLGVSGSGHPGRRAALHDAPSQPRPHGHYPRQAAAGGSRTEEGSGACGQERPVT